MKIIVFGLTISSSWGNGHATIWRGLCRSLAKRGHDIVFFERDVPYYARHRDLAELPGMKLKLYSSWEDVMPFARSCLSEADAAFVTSYCPDGLSASDLVLSSNARARIFYDLDAPVTLERMKRGETVDYISPDGLAGFDIVLSYTGGKTLDELQRTLGAGKTAPLYGSVDPFTHGPVEISCQADLSYLGTYADDRQEMLTKLLIEPARRLPGKRFVIGGSLYPESFPWNHNIYYRRHIAPPQHPEFYCSSRLTLNVTRGAMTRMGYLPIRSAVRSRCLRGADCKRLVGRSGAFLRTRQGDIDCTLFGRCYRCP